MPLLTQFVSRGTKIPIVARLSRHQLVKGEEDEFSRKISRYEEAVKKERREEKEERNEGEGQTNRKGTALQAVNKEMIVWRMNGAAEALLITH